MGPIKLFNWRKAAGVGLPVDLGTAVFTGYLVAFGFEATLLIWGVAFAVLVWLGVAVWLVATS